MKPTWWPGEKHELFTEWAKSQGIVINGVSPARFPGRGLGMIATRKIEKDSILVKVPHSAMLTPSKLPSTFTSRFPADTPTHTLYAAYLTNASPSHLTPWRNTWPTMEDFTSSMPILWSSSSPLSPSSTRNTSKIQDLLPPSISNTWSTISPGKRKHKYDTRHQNLLKAQETRLRKAWDIVVRVFPETDKELFTYHWVIVNTRSFFYLLPGAEMPEDRNDAMALVPFADYFNHSDVACNVKFDGEEYVFRAAKEYNEGEEIYMSYGPHSNDFLFTEYGFYLDTNASETLYLDEIILQDLNASKQEELEFHQYYGNYQLTSEGVCYRTEIAAGLTYMPLRLWQDYVLGYSTDGVDEKMSAAVIRGWIGVYIKEADEAMARLEDLYIAQTEDQGVVRMLLKRWRQIRALCEEAIDRMSS
ncbi:SET domain-containing protein, partial [Aspergillus costaricaensis CBS 115574]